MTSEKIADADFLANTDFVAQMRPALMKYFKRKCGVTHEAEDLTQDVLMRTLAHATWKSPEQAKGYIFRVAINRWRDRVRKARTRGVTVEWTEGVEQHLAEYRSKNEERTPERVLMVEDELNRLSTALLQLNERTRDVFMLIRLEHMKQSTVAEMLGVSVSTVEKELVKALAHLALCMKRSEGTP